MQSDGRVSNMLTERGVQKWQCELAYLSAWSFEDWRVAGRCPTLTHSTTTMQISAKINSDGIKYFKK